MEMLGGGLLVVFVLAALVIWAIKSEIPRLNAENKRLDEKRRRLQLRREQMDEVKELSKKRAQLFKEGRVEEALRVNEYIQVLLKIL